MGVPREGSAKANELKKTQDASDKAKSATQAQAASDNKRFKDAQDEYDKKYNTLAYQVRTSEAGGTYLDSSGRIVTVLSREDAIKQGIERSREAAKQVRAYDKLTKEEKQDLIDKYGERTPSPPDNEEIGNRADVFYRDADDQARVRESYIKRVNNLLGSSETTQVITTTHTNYQLELNEQLSLYEDGKKPYQKTRALQAREFAEGISSGEYENQYIGTKGADILGYEAQAESQQKFRDKEVLPIAYTDEKGKELVTITGKSEGAEFKIFGKSEPIKLIDVNAPIPREKNIVDLAEEKSPLHQFLGGNPSGIKESVKGVVKSGVQLGIDAAVGLVGPQTLGIDTEEKRKDFVSKFEKAYPKELQPLETPLTLLASGRPPITQYGLKYDIQSGATDVLLFATATPKLEKLVNIKSFAFQSGSSKVAQLEYGVLKEPGVVHGVQKEGETLFSLGKGTEGRSGTLSTKLEPKLQLIEKGKKKGFQYPENPKRVIIPDPSKSAKIPLTIIETGKRPYVEEVKPTITKIIPGDVYQTNIRGTLTQSQQNLLGAQKVSKFDYQIVNPTKLQQAYLKAQIESKKIQPFAIGKRAPINTVLESNPEKIRKYALESEPTVYKKTISQGTAKPSADVVAQLEKGYNFKPEGEIILKKTEFIKNKEFTQTLYAYTKAEKKIDYLKESEIFKKLKLPEGYGPRINPDITRVYKPTRPWDIDLADIQTKIGAGQAGKARSLSAKEEGIIIQSHKTAIPKPREDFLGSIHEPVFLSALAAESLTIQYPPGTSLKQPTLQSTATTPRLSTKQQPSVIQKVSTGQQSKTILGQAAKLSQKTIQKTQLKLESRTELLPRLMIKPVQMTRTKQALIPRYVQKQVTRQKLIELPKVPLIPKEKLIPKIIPISLPMIYKRTRPRKYDKGSRLDFLGSVPLGSIAGVYNRPDIIYGDKKIASILRKEKRGQTFKSKLFGSFGKQKSIKFRL